MTGIFRRPSSLSAGPTLIMLIAAALFAATALLCAPRADAQGPSATEIMEKMETMINGFDDQQMDVTMVIIDTDGIKKSYDFTVYQKGDVKRYVIFTSGEIKGLATLIEDKDHVYAYLPGFKKVRRVAAHNMNQGFAGSDFSSNDMATVSWTKSYDCRIEKQDTERWYLLATPKPGVESDYAKALVWVDKKTFTQVGVEYFNAKGEKVKVFSNSEMKDFQGVPRATLVVLSDPRTGHKTELHIRGFKYNQGLKDEMFTVRQLQWGK